MKIALACDHLLARDFSVEILDRLVEIFPGAPIYTFAFKPGVIMGEIEHRRIEASYLSHKVQHPADLEKHKFLMPSIASHLCIQGDFDVLISVSSGFAHGIKVPRKAKHISYIWHKDQSYSFNKSWLQKLFNPFLKNWKNKKIAELDKAFFSSKTLFSEVDKIVHPPVNLENFPKPFSHRAEKVLINASFISEAELVSLIKICEQAEIEFLCLDTNYSQRNWQKIGLKAEQVVYSKCPSDLKMLFDKCFALLDFSPGEFNPEMITALALGRPLILRDYKIFKEYFNTETAVFITDEDRQNLGKKLQEMKTHQDAFFPSTMQKKTFSFHPTRFKHVIQKEVDSLCSPIT